MARRLLSLSLGVLVLAGLAWALWPRPMQVELARIEPRDLTVTVEAEGRTAIREVFTVSAPISGRLLRLGLTPGDAVVKGETVIASILPVAPALLDARARRVAEAVRDAAKAGTGLAEAQVRQAEAELTFRRAEARRAEALRSREAIPARSLDEALLAEVAAEAALASARAGLAMRERELESAEAALMEGGTEPDRDAFCCTTIKAPVSGRVLRVVTESEQTVAAGTPLAEIGDPADLEIVADLLSNDAVRVHPGALARVEGWGGPPQPAVVSRVEPSAFTKTSALGIEEQRVTVRLDLTGDPAARAAMGDGYRVIARITVWEGKGLLTVPVGALFRQGADWAVYQAVDGRARLRRVTLGERTDSHAELTGGLEAGAEVILHPGDRIAEGSRITGGAG